MNEHELDEGSIYNSSTELPYEVSIKGRHGGKINSERTGAWNVE